MLRWIDKLRNLPNQEPRIFAYQTIEAINYLVSSSTPKATFGDNRSNKVNCSFERDMALTFALNISLVTLSRGS